MTRTVPLFVARSLPFTYKFYFLSYLSIVHTSTETRADPRANAFVGATGYRGESSVDAFPRQIDTVRAALFTLRTMREASRIMLT